MRSLLCALSSLLIVSTLASADEPTAPPGGAARSETALVDTLEQANLQEAIRILLKSYIKRDSLDSLELNRAALQGLLDRAGFGASLVDRKNDPADSFPPQALVVEQLGETVGYIRPGTFSPDETADVGRHLAELDKGGATTLILDLRAPVEGASFQDAAKFLHHFCPPNSLLFKIQKPGQNRPVLFLSKPATQWKNELLVLIDGQTPPAAEAIAAVLRRERDPFFIGGATPGQTVEYERVNIGDDVSLRFAVAEVIFADDESIFRSGIQPHLSASMPIGDKLAIFQESEEVGMKPFLFSKQQPRLNEAALVAGTDPELDYAIAASAGRDTGYDTIPNHDRVVQAALDFLVTTKFLKLEPSS